MAEKATPDDELFVHLNLAGLVALLKATEAAIATGRGRIELGSGSRGIAVTSGDAPFATLILTFSDSGGGGLALPPSPTGCSAHATR